MNRDEALACFEQYLQRRFPGRRTPIDYLSDVRLFARMYDKPWRDVTMQDIDAFVDQQRQAGRSPATVKRRVAALKTFFDFLAEETGELAWPNPVRFKRHAGKQPQALPRDLSEAEVERLWAVVTSARDRAWFVLLWRAGLRVGEVVSLSVANVLSPPTGDQPARLRVCGKGRKERVVLLSADAYAVLAVWLAQRPPDASAAVFVNARGQPLSVSGVEWQLRHYGQQAGVAVSPHRLRHTFARQVTEAGMPLASVGKLLGHADLTTTQRYTAGADPQLAQAYQQAMQQLGAAAALPTPSGPPPPAPAPLLAAEPAPAFDPGRWANWEPALPASLRQACLAFVQRGWPTWKARRRRTNASKILAEFRRFWHWQMVVHGLADWQALRLADLHAYQAARLAQGAASTTINRTLAYVLSLLQAQLEHGAPLAAELLRWRPLPRPDSLPRHLSGAESQRLDAQLRARLAAASPEQALSTACVAVLAHTGLRAGECLDLQLQDLDLVAGRLVVRNGKGLKDRVVYLSPLASQAVRVYLGDTPRPANSPLLTRAAGRPISYQWLRDQVEQLGAAAGVAHVSPHRLRHTLATQLLNAGMDITRIQKLLGHAFLNTTQIYARVQDATLEADYRLAMQTIERQQMPLSLTAEPAPDWPAKHKVPIDNSV